MRGYGRDDNWAGGRNSSYGRFGNEDGDNQLIINDRNADDDPIDFDRRNWFY